MDAITADSKPVWAYIGLFGDYWKCGDFITWHKELVKKYGLEKANQTFLSEWENAPLINAGYDCRSFNADFKQYAKDNGFYDALFSGIGGLIGKPLSIGAGLVDSAGNVVQNAGDTFEKSSAIVKKVLPVVLIAAAVFVVVYGYKHLKTA